MSHVVWKYPVPVEDDFSLELPAGAQVLSVGVQDNQPYLWVKVDTDRPMHKTWFHLRGTGHGFNGTEGRYIGTFQILDGRFVGHLFEHLDSTVRELIEGLFSSEG